MKSITISADNLYIAISAYKQLRTISIDFAPIINNEITIYFNDFRFYQLVEFHILDFFFLYRLWLVCIK